MSKKKLSAIVMASSIAVLTSAATNAEQVTLDEATLIGTESILAPGSTISINSDYLTNDSINIINRNLMINRAAEVYQWALPLASFQMWYNAHNQVFNARYNYDFVSYESMNEKSGIITSNATTPYVISFMNLENTGPLVVEVPPGKMAGGLYDFYQVAVQDIGLVGPDKGKGGQYLVIPPGYDESELETDDYFVIRPRTNKLLYGIRILIQDPEEVAKMQSGFKVAPYGKPLQSAGFIGKTNKRWRGHPYRGYDFFKLVHQSIQGEPILREDLIFKTYMNDLGIADGKPLEPTAEQREILDLGAKTGELGVRANQQRPRHDEPYFTNRKWVRLLSNFPLYRVTDALDRYYLDESNQYYYEAVTISRGMTNNTPAFSTQSYLTTHTDDQGHYLDGSKTYKLHLPNGIPAENFWSLVVYSEESRCFIDNGGRDARSVAFNSRMKSLQYNRDGSIDLFIGPKAPKGKEANWIKSNQGEGWFALFRFYGTEKPFFDKSWVIGDFEEVGP
ncbi:MAG: DUF1214 domain-containing protein [Pseudomonadales bacterium]